MQNRFLFRDGGRVVRTHNVARDAAWAFAACAALLGLLAWGHAVDQEGNDRGLFEAGLVVGRQQMQDTVADAYRQGMLDALAGGPGCQPDVPAPAAVALMVRVAP